MSHAEHTPNHAVDPATGFLESNAYAAAFDAERKTQFLNLFKSNGLGLYRTCKQLGLSHHTINKHYRIDPEFKKAYDDAEKEYTDELEATSRFNALNPKSVIERIFQLKALRPERYADQKSAAPTQITINVDAALIENARKRAEVLDAEIITESERLTASNSTDRHLVDHNTSDNTHSNG